MHASGARSEPQASGVHSETSRRARAALAVAALLFALPLAGGEPPPADCPAPGERRAAAGHSVALACASAPGRRPVRGPARRLVGLAIDPNRADAATLESLPGVGPARAEAIIEARASRPFRRLEDLDRVPGLGPRTLAGLAGAIAIGARDQAPPRPALARPTRTR
jgi:competence protein ComEA